MKALQQRGFSLVVIARILGGELDAADEALVEAVVAGGDEADGEQEEFWTLAELGRRAGVPETLARGPRARRASSSPGTSSGAARYTEADLVALRAGLKLLEYGLPLGEVLELARAHDRRHDWWPSGP